MKTIRTLMPAELCLYRAHLLRLGPADRRLRFGGSVSDDAIAATVARINPATTKVIAACDHNLRVIAAVQISRVGWSTVELAFSVEPAWRRQGLGTALMRRATLLARNRGAATVRLHCLRENVPIRRLSQSAGLTQVADADEVDGEAVLSAATPLSVLQEIVWETVGLLSWAGRAAGWAAWVAPPQAPPVSVTAATVPAASL
jgi:GNAT superfamily N-acetyltransferase